MDTFDNNAFELEENKEEMSQEQAAVSQEDTKNQEQPQEKASPYANSPYTMGWQGNENANGYQPQHTQPVYQRSAAPEMPRKAKQGKGSIWRPLVASVLTVALVASGCVITADQVNRRWEASNRTEVDALNARIEDLQNRLDGFAGEIGNGNVNPVASNGVYSPVQVYDNCVESVVAISCTVQTTAFGQTATGQSAGSGFVLSEDGYIVTNAHVVENASSVTITTYSGKEYDAKVVGKDSGVDVAVLKVEAEGLQPVVLGSSDALTIGDMVVAIGNPLGELAATQTVGYVSGKNREVSTDNSIMDMIQTDAAINPGNSGGPLFNLKGQVVGITTAKYSGTTSSGASIEGIGFAIPIDDILGVIEDLKNLGYVTGAYLGVTVQNTDAESAAMFDLPLGAYVVTVVEGGSADKAGVQPKDIITALGESPVGGVTELTRTLRGFKAGDITTITVVRGGQELVLPITLDEKPQQNAPAAPDADPNMPSEGDYREWFDYFNRQFGKENG